MKRAATTAADPRPIEARELLRLDALRFLADSHTAVPLGTERVDVDDWVAQLLEEAP